MNLITNIDNSPKQYHEFSVGNGTVVKFQLEYRPNQMGWFYSLSWSSVISGLSFTVNNRRLVTSPNMLREFKEIIPFGIACSTDDGQEPVFLNDFYRGRAKLHLLTNADDVAQMESFIAS